MVEAFNVSALAFCHSKISLSSADFPKVSLTVIIHTCKGLRSWQCCLLPILWCDLDNHPETETDPVLPILQMRRLRL